MTEREEFEEWFDAANNYELQHDYGRGCKAGWDAGRAPLLKRIEELEFAVKVLSDGIEGGTEK